MGLWVLLLIPLPAFLYELRLPYEQNAPYSIRDAVRDWNQTYAAMIYPTLAFVIGSVLLFARERGTRPRKLDRVRRWAVLASYLALLLGLASVAGVTFMVLSGIDGMLNPPGSIEFRRFAWGPGRLWSERAWYASGFMGVAIMTVAGIILYDALRRAGATWTAKAFVVLGVGCLVIQLIPVVGVVAKWAWAENVDGWDPFFQAHVLAYEVVQHFHYLHGDWAPLSEYGVVEFDPSSATAGEWATYAFRFPSELIKWLLVFYVATRLTAAQVAGHLGRPTGQADVNS